MTITLTTTTETTPYDRILLSRLAIEVVAEKWRIAVLHQLSRGPLRTAQLQRALDKIAPKVLTQTLRGLERDGLVQRRAYAVVPARVDYRLTEIGLILLDALEDLCRWSQVCSHQVALARRSYDAQTYPCSMRIVSRG